MRVPRPLLVLALAACSVTACTFNSIGPGPDDAGGAGDDDAPSKLVDASTDATIPGDASADVGSTAPDAGGGTPDGAAAGFCATVTDTTGCTGCSCTSCTSAMNDCAADSDCVALVSCYQTSGCSDVLACFQPGGPCAATYGAHGGGAAPGQALATCLQGSCVAECTGGAQSDAGAPPFDGGASPACTAIVGDAGACTSCACHSCASTSNACFADADCAALERCFEAEGCLDPSSCFSGKCATTYQAHASGASAALALYDCERTAGCSQACALAQPPPDAGGPCGALDQPCCPASAAAEPTCNAGLACRSDATGSVCGCGQEGEPCCANGACLGPSGLDSRLQCFNGTCGYCYTAGATVCTLPPCVGPGLCCNGCDLVTMNGCSFAVTCK